MKKKILALLLAMAMTMGMSTVAFAADTESTITIKDNADDQTVHTYKVYQIFTGTVTKNDAGIPNGLTSIKWGAGVTGTISFNNVNYDTTDNQDAAKLARALENQANAKDFAKAIQSNLVSSPNYTATQSNKDANVEITVPTGYYFIADADVTGEGSVSEYIVQLSGPVEVTAKSEVPSTIKKIKDINDSDANGYTGWQDSADYDIGDKIPYKFESTIPSNAKNYENAYQFIFHDDLSAGLTFDDESVVVTVGQVTLTKDTDYTITEANCAGENCTCDFYITINDLRNYAGEKVVVEYEATLNNNAVIGSAGNPNKMYLEFSNNPHGDGKGKTPEQTAIAFTYTVRVDKQDENGDPLSGAMFKLEKFIKGTTNEDGTATTDAWTEIAIVETTPDTVFTFKGIDDGIYRLSETGTPDGYNKILDDYVIFKVESAHDVNKGDSSAYVAPSVTILTDLSGLSLAENTVANTQTYSFGNDSNNDAIITTAIENQSGSLLPSTGGIGTTLFYVIGGILVVGGGAMLFVKRKMGREEI